MKLLLTTIKNENIRTELELKYLYSVVADSPMDVKLRLYEHNDLYTDIFEELVSGQYDAVYFHCSDRNEGQLLHVAGMLKKAAKSTAVVFGGMHVSFETRKFMKDNPFVDFVIRGEGERVLYNFVRTLLDYDADFENIAGLAYRDGSQVVVNPYDAPVDMDDLPFPYDRFEAESGTVCYESIRGTSDRTAYAQYLPDARVRALSLARVCTELRYFLVSGVERVVFLDRWFNYNTDRAYKILEYIIHNDNGKTTFEFNMNGDDLDEETLRLLAEARPGQIVFNMDIASTNAEVLAAIGRSENIYRLMYSVTRLRRSGTVRTELSLRAGLPLENGQMFARSFNKAFGMAEGDPLHIRGLCVSKGTLLRAEAKRYGYVYSEEPPYELISTDRMDADTLLRIRRTARVVERYSGSGLFSESLTRILNDTGIKPYDLFESLSSFIIKNGYEGRMHRKENLARVLYAFAAVLYGELADSVRLDILKEVIYSELEAMVSEDSIRKFDRRGWEIGSK